MENKYYTPDISEFRLGFKYDEKYIANTTNSEWCSCVATYHRDGKYGINDGCIENIFCDDDNGWAEYRVRQVRYRESWV